MKRTRGMQCTTCAAVIKLCLFMCVCAGARACVCVCSFQMIKATKVNKIWSNTAVWPGIKLRLSPHTLHTKQPYCILMSSHKHAHTNTHSRTPAYANASPQSCGVVSLVPVIGCYLSCLEETARQPGLPPGSAQRGGSDNGVEMWAVLGDSLEEPPPRARFWTDAAA